MRITLFFICAILLYFTIQSCGDRKKQSKLLITNIGVQSISVPEPSGLDVTFDRTGFWTVSDESSSIYRLDNEGNVVQTIPVNGSDLEGITVIDEQRIAVILERDREVLILDKEGNELQRKKLPLEGEANSGLEGITYNLNNGHFYILNEKKPSLLIELNEELDILSIDTLNFSKDVSGIFYDDVNNHLWILSDENQLVVKCDLNGVPQESIRVDIVQPEGITIDKKGSRLYIVSDNTESLYVYRINE
jgi:uncharacterized protein YjiK